MALLVGELYALLKVEKKEFEAGLAEAKIEASAAGRSIGQSLQSAGKIIATGLGVAAIATAAIGYESIKAASEFQSSMELIQTQAGASTEEVQSMTKAVLGMAGSVGTGPDALAEGLYHIESAGIRGAKALDVLHTAALGAKLGNADLESVTNALVAEVNSGISGVTGMSEAMGVLNGIVGSGNMRMQDLSDTMSTGILSVAKTFGVSIQSVGAALATMTDQGVPAVDAATKIKTALISMAAPIGATKKAFASIGIGTRDLAEQLASPAGIVGALQMLKTHMDAAGLDAIEQGQLIANAFGKRGGPAVMTLLNSLEMVATKEEAITEATGGFDEAVSHLMQETSFKAEQTAASIGAIAVQIGTALLPIVNDLLDAINTGLSSDGLQAVFKAIGTGVGIAADALGVFVGIIGEVWKILGDLGMQGPIIAAAVGLITAAFVAWGIAAAGAAIGVIAATWPVIAVIAAVAIAVKALQLIFEYFGIDITKVVGDAFAWIGKTVKDFIQAILSVAGTIVGIFALLPGPLQDSAKEMQHTLDLMHDQVGEWGTATAQTAADAGDSVARGMGVGFDDSMDAVGRGMGIAANDAGAEAGKAVGEGALAQMGLTDEQMKTLGLSATGALADGVDEGSGAVVDATKTLVERFGTSLQSVTDAAKVAGGAAMAQMAQGIQDARNAPLDAFNTLKTMLKNAMDPAAENARLVGQLISKQLAQGLRSKDPAVRAQAIATKKLIIDRLNELAASGAPLGKKAMDELKKGIKSKDKDIHNAAVAAQKSIMKPLNATKGKAGAAGATAAKAFGNAVEDNIRNLAVVLKVRVDDLGSNRRGYASGAWNIRKKELAFLHAGEMVVPAAAAARLRADATAPAFGALAGMPGASGPMIGSLSVTINAGSDVSPARARRFGQTVLDVVADGLREQTARMAS